MKKPKLGSGGRFKKLKNEIKKKSGYSEERAEAAAAAIGRKKYGKKKMTQLAVKGRKRKAKE